MKYVGYAIGYTFAVTCYLVAQAAFVWAVSNYLIGFDLTSLQALGIVLLFNFLPGTGLPSKQ